MTKNLAKLILSLLILACLPVRAQTNTFCQNNFVPTANANKLICLLPNLGFPPVTSGLDPIGGLDAAIASQASLFPLASPASGIVYTTDPALQLTTASNESFGPVMFERGETLHRRKFFLAFTYQNFQFGNMDGINLKNVPAVFPASQVPGGPIVGSVETSNRIDLKINQFAAYATYGITNHLDVSVAVPFLDVKLGAVATCGDGYTNATGITNPPGNCISNAANDRFPYRTQSGSATGIGDIILRAKYSVWQGERMRVAAAVDVRLPTGDKYNFLGTGAAGVRPFAAVSFRGRIAPHADLGFQWNGNSDIASAQGPGASGKLPNNLFYVLGADARVVKRLTLSGDYLGQRVFSALREGIATQSPSGFSGIYTYSGSFNTNYATAGGKVNPVGALLLTANVLFKLDNNGLHNKPAPMVGISYVF